MRHNSNKSKVFVLAAGLVLASNVAFSVDSSQYPCGELHDLAQSHGTPPSVSQYTSQERQQGRDYVTGTVADNIDSVYGSGRTYGGEVEFGGVDRKRFIEALLETFPESRADTTQSDFILDDRMLMGQRRLKLLHDQPAWVIHEFTRGENETNYYRLIDGRDGSTYDYRDRPTLLTDVPRRLGIGDLHKDDFWVTDGQFMTIGKHEGGAAPIRFTFDRSTGLMTSQMGANKNPIELPRQENMEDAYQLIRSMLGTAAFKTDATVVRGTPAGDLTVKSEVTRWVESPQPIEMVSSPVKWSEAAGDGWDKVEKVMRDLKAKGTSPELLVGVHTNHGLTEADKKDLGQFVQRLIVRWGEGEREKAAGFFQPSPLRVSPMPPFKPFYGNFKPEFVADVKSIKDPTPEKVRDAFRKHYGMIGNNKNPYKHMDWFLDYLIERPKKGSGNQGDVVLGPERNELRFDNTPNFDQIPEGEPTPDYWRLRLKAEFGLAFLQDVSDSMR